MKPEYKTKILSFAVLTIALLLYLYPTITNEATPGGDGKRIFPYIEFVNNADCFCPLWNPYKLGGVPTLANPDRFTWLGKLISVEYEYANLILNLVFVFIALLLSFSAYVLSKELSISNKGAIIVALVLAYSQFTREYLDTGRIYWLVSFLLVNIALILYIKYIKTKNLWFAISSSAISGAVIAIMGYLATVLFFPLMFVLGWYYNKKETVSRNPFSTTLIQVFILSLFGILSFFVFILPLTYYNAISYARLKPLLLLESSLPIPASVLRIFIPVKDGGFYFVSLAALPLLIFLLLNIRHSRKKPVSIFFFIFLGSLIFLMGGVYPFKFLILLFQKTPILYHIRYALVFYYLLTFSLAFLSGFGYDVIDRHNPRKKWMKVFPIFAIIFLIMTSLFLDFVSALPEIRNNSLKSTLNISYLFGMVWPPSWKLIIITVILMFPYTGSRKKSLVKLYIIVLIVMQVILFREVAAKVSRASNKPEMHNITKALNNDHSYYRACFYRAAFWGQQRRFPQMPKVQILDGHSLYFSKEHRWQLENLFGKKIRAVRAYWVTHPRLEQWDNETMELLNIKYIITGRKFPVFLRTDWDPVTRDGMYNLWKKKDWKSSLVIFDRWKIEPEVDDVLRQMRNPSFNPFEKVFLEKSPGMSLDTTEIPGDYRIQIAKFATEDIILKITTNKNGILFLPEYFDNGWKVKVDGVSGKVIRADASFRGIPVTKGHHTIRIYYSPTVVYVGAIVSIITILFGISGIIIYQKRFANKRRALLHGTYRTSFS